MSPDPSRSRARSKRMVWLLAWGLLAVVARPATARSLAVDELRSTIDVDPDGRIRVEERIAVDFSGGWEGIVREIPYRQTTPSGRRGTIRLGIDAVEDADGNPLEHRRRRANGVLRVRIEVPDARDARRTVVLRYHAENAIFGAGGAAASYGVHDELHWNVTGHGWQVPIRRARVELHLPPEVPAETVRAVAYTAAGAAHGAAHPLDRPADDRLVFDARDVPPHAALIVTVGFPPGHVEHPSALRRAGWLVADHALLAVPLLLPVIWLAVWWGRGRGPRGQPTVVADWKPPADLRPSEVGVLIDERMDRRDLTASILDLAVRGVLAIREADRPAGSGREFVLLLNERALDGARLETFEEALIDGLFGGDSEVRLRSLKRRFFDKIERVNRKVLDDLVVKGLLRACPDGVRRRWMVLTAVALVAAAVVGLAGRVSPPFWWLLGVASVTMVVLARRMPGRTRSGLDALARVRGLEEFLAGGDRERTEPLGLQQAERLLPYAVALNLHDRWAEVFADRFEQAPSWYAARDGTWTPRGMGRVVDDLNRSVAANLYSVPRTAVGRRER